MGSARKATTDYDLQMYQMPIMMKNHDCVFIDAAIRRVRSLYPSTPS
jgi:hypothetical protein